MKITFSPSNSSDTFTFEGSLEELDTIVSRIIASENKPKTVKPAKTTVSNPKPAANTVQRSIQQFLDHVYLYAANPANDTGKGRYIAEILSDFKPHTRQQIVAGTNIVDQTIDKNVRKLRAAGAIVNVTGDTITLVSIPNKRFTKKRRANASTKKVVASQPIAEALKGFKVS
jgi:hypothetical protein